MNVLYITFLIVFLIYKVIIIIPINMIKKILIAFILFNCILNSGECSINKTKVELLKKKLESLNAKEHPPILLELAKIHLKDASAEAMLYGEEALKLSKKYNLTNYEADSKSVLASIFFYQNDYRQAIKAYEDELDLRKTLGNPENLALVYFNLGSVYMKSEKEQKAIKSYENSLENAKKANLHDLILEINRSLFNIYFDKKNFKKALIYFNEYVRIKDSTFTKQNQLRYSVLTKNLEESKSEIIRKDSVIGKKDATIGLITSERDTLKIETVIKDKKIETLNFEKAYQEKVIQNQRLLRNFLIVGIFFVFIIVLILVRMYLFKKRTNKMLVQKNDEILQQNEEILQQKEEIETQRDHIEKQSKHITDSIVYAERIQKAALPDDDILKHIGFEYFIYFKPRDIVSGDFYWMKRIEKHVVIIAADCTGHGVPGAFVSMLGMSFLNEIIPVSNFNLSAAEILEKLRIAVKKSLKQTGKMSEPKDGMDISLCIINENDYTLEFAGAFNPLFQVRNGELNVIKPTLNPIGIHFKEIPFENNKINLQKDDMYYIFSDGYCDQFGGDKGDKFSKKQFKQLLSNISDRLLPMQLEVLENVMDKWKGTAYEQIDDQLIIGFRV